MSAEVSILIGAIGFLTYNLIAPVLQMKFGSKDSYSPVNKYYGENMYSEIDYSRCEIRTDVFGTPSIRPRKVKALCGEDHWKVINDKHLIH
ncbi:hypothetical protein ACFL57_00545 [Candidatus Margulisiibacteriota bacterium]